MSVLFHPQTIFHPLASLKNWSYWIREFKHSLSFVHFCDDIRFTSLIALLLVSLSSWWIMPLPCEILPSSSAKFSTLCQNFFRMSRLASWPSCCLKDDVHCAKIIWVLVRPIYDNSVAECLETKGSPQCRASRCLSPSIIQGVAKSNGVVDQ